MKSVKSGAHFPLLKQVLLLRKAGNKIETRVVAKLRVGYRCSFLWRLTWNRLGEFWVWKLMRRDIPEGSYCCLSRQSLQSMLVLSSTCFMHIVYWCWIEVNWWWWWLFIINLNRGWAESGHSAPRNGAQCPRKNRAKPWTLMLLPDTKYHIYPCVWVHILSYVPTMISFPSPRLSPFPELKNTKLEAWTQEFYPLLPLTAKRIHALEKRDSSKTR